MKYKLLFLCIILNFQLFYFVKINFSPIYIFLCLGLFFYYSIILFSHRFFISKIRVDNIILLCFAITVFFLHGYPISGSIVNLLIGILSYCAVNSIELSFNCPAVRKVIRISLQVSLLLLTIDTLWRLLNPITDIQQIIHYESVGTWFYIYKFNSIMFADSNLAGIASMTFSLLAYYLFRIGWGKNYFSLALLFFINNLLSFSRSSILACIITIFIATIYYNYRRLSLLILPLISLIIFIVFYNFSYNDESFQTKIQIFINILNYFSTTTLDIILFGLGFGGFFSQFDIAAHAIYATYFVEIGLLGSFLFILFILYLFTTSKAAFFYGILPVLLSGISYYPYAGMPFLFTTLAILKRVEPYVKNEKNI